MIEQINNVTVLTKANVYFDGKCVSHTMIDNNGKKTSVGVILPSTLTFNTAAGEIMYCVAGSCKVRLSGNQDWQIYQAGESFQVAANSSFEISCSEVYHYICTFLDPLN